MFTGEYERSLDSKGRLMLPPVWRSELTVGGYLARSTSSGPKCVDLITEETMRATADRLLEGVREGRYTADEQRRWASSLTPVQLDGQGRIVVPPTLRDHAGITGSVMLVGNLNRAEIWSIDHYSAWEETTGDDGGAVFY